MHKEQDTDNVGGQIGISRVPKTVSWIFPPHHWKLEAVHIKHIPLEANIGSWDRSEPS
jgi:hypothetical protein